jgi:predicted nucleic acid-binding protein
LEGWLTDQLIPRFNDRVLPIDITVADAWGRLVAQREAKGRPIGVLDAFLAATANVHDMALVTRNEADFTGTVKSIVNPWAAG